MPTPTPPGAARPRVPGNELVMAANAGLSQSAFRDRVREMHAQDYSLVRMVEDLGLGGDMTPRIREILEHLPHDVVTGIRQATLTMLDSADYVMPLDCTVTDQELNDGMPVDVEVEPEEGRPTIHVRPEPSSS